MILSLYLSHLLKVGSKLTSEAKAIPPEETLRKNVLEKGPEMMEDLQGETSGMYSGLRVWQTASAGELGSCAAQV